MRRSHCPSPDSPAPRPAEKSRAPRRFRYALWGGALLLGGIHALAAPMYQWTDPQTGSVQLAGHPPPWFRTGAPGPRVRVFEHGKVVDDTAYAPAIPPPMTPAPTSAAPRVTDTGTTPAPTDALASPGAAFDQREEFRALLKAWDREQAAQAPTAAPAARGSTVPAPPPH